MNDLAGDILKRANDLGISMADLCRQAKVSRRWYEYFKKRIPKSVDVYVKVDECLKQMEINKQKPNDHD